MRERRIGRCVLRIGAWPGAPDTAHLTVAPGGEPPTPEGLRRVLEELTAEGWRHVVTAALGPRDVVPYLAAGFVPRATLALLVRDLGTAAPVPAPAVPAGVVLRRSGVAERAALVGIDNRAFPPFWHLDLRMLADAVAATPAARVRVAEDGGRIAGFAVTGRAGPRGYLQRLAVEPDAQGRGIGRLLVLDSLRWLRRRSALRCFVNTQDDNEPALGLYRALGFVDEPDGLLVLRADLTPPNAPAAPARLVAPTDAADPAAGPAS